MSTNLETARRFIQAIESRPAGETLAAFFHPEVTQHEFPNRLVPQGKTRDLRALLESSEKGKQVLVSQHYEIFNALETGDHVSFEFEWTGILKVALGSLPAGGTLRARCAMFLAFRDGRILSMHNYDCFEPF